MWCAYPHNSKYTKGSTNWRRVLMQLTITICFSVHVELLYYIVWHSVIVTQVQCPGETAHCDAIFFLRMDFHQQTEKTRLADVSVRSAFWTSDNICGMMASIVQRLSSSTNSLVKIEIALPVEMQTQQWNQLTVIGQSCTSNLFFFLNPGVLTNLLHYKSVNFSTVSSMTAVDDHPQRYTLHMNFHV